MKSTENNSLFTRIGGLLGFVTFLLYGLKAGFVYGGLVGVITSAAMLGHALDGALPDRIIVAGGMFLGVLAVGMLMTVLGAVFGTVVDAVVSPLRKPREKLVGEGHADPHDGAKSAS